MCALGEEKVTPRYKMTTSGRSYLSNSLDCRPCQILPWLPLEGVRARSHLSRACRVALAEGQIETELAPSEAVTGLLCSPLFTMKRDQIGKPCNARCVNLVLDIVVLRFRGGSPGVSEVVLIIDTNMRFMCKSPTCYIFLVQQFQAMGV